MIRRLLIHQQAKDDLILHYAYIARDKQQPADDLLAAARSLFDHLIRFPDLGRRWTSAIPRLHGIRLIPLPGYPNYLVFYRPTAREVRILTVIHGTRDLPAMLRLVDQPPDQG